MLLWNILTAASIIKQESVLFEFPLLSVTMSSLIAWLLNTLY